MRFAQYTNLYTACSSSPSTTCLEYRRDPQSPVASLNPASHNQPTRFACLRTAYAERSRDGQAALAVAVTQHAEHSDLTQMNASHTLWSGRSSYEGKTMVHVTCREPLTWSIAAWRRPYGARSGGGCCNSVSGMQLAAVAWDLDGWSAGCERGLAVRTRDRKRGGVGLGCAAVALWPPTGSVGAVGRVQEVWRAACFSRWSSGFVRCCLTAVAPPHHRHAIGGVGSLCWSFEQAAPSDGTGGCGDNAAPAVSPGVSLESDHNLSPSSVRSGASPTVMRRTSDGRV